MPARKRAPHASQRRPGQPISAPSRARPERTPARIADEARAIAAAVRWEQQVLAAPSLWLMALEWRAPLEYGATIASLPWLLRAPAGDGHPVLVFPGLVAGDLSTAALRVFLRSRGYKVQGWKQGLNLGARAGVIDKCLKQVHRLADQHGRRVSLIGWSLGGIFAREVAKDLPDLVRCVITLGSPFNGNARATNAWRLYELAAGHSIEEHPRRHGIGRAPPVPTTSIYSRTDGVVAWQCCLIDRDREQQTENIEVVASHFGIGMNPAAMYAIADRLAQPEARWRPFHRDGWRAAVFPSPAQ